MLLKFQLLNSASSFCCSDYNQNRSVFKSLVALNTCRRKSQISMFLIRTYKIYRGSSIVECGSGWNLSLLKYFNEMLNMLLDTLLVRVKIIL